MAREICPLKRRLLMTATMACACLSACRAAKGPESAASVAPRREAVAATKIRRTLIDRRSAAGLPGWETRLYLVNTVRERWRRRTCIPRSELGLSSKAALNLPSGPTLP